MLKSKTQKIEQKTWDPAVIYFRGSYYAYCLQFDDEPHPYWIENELEPDPFMSKNHLHLYRSQDLNSWTDCGKVISPLGETDITCAASVVCFEDTIYLFYGVATLTKLKGEVYLDQRLRLATSTDGINFIDHDQFSLEPDPQLYPFGRPYPTGGFAYAWRDPYLHYCDRTQTYYLYIVTGGGCIWGTEPQIAVAKAKNIAGPYELLTSALDPRKQPGFISGLTSELERIDIKFLDNKYYLFGSSWKYYLSEEFKSFLKQKKIPISNYNTYVFTANNPEGPFEINREDPVVNYRYGWLISPDIYAKYFFAKPNGSIGVCGWYSALFRLALSNSFEMTKKGDRFTISYNLNSIIKYWLARLKALGSQK